MAIIRRLAVSTPASDMVASGASHAHGLAPDPGATPGTTKFLREDATFAVPPGSGTPSRGYFAYLSALLEPEAIEPMDTNHVGIFTYVVGASVTKLLMAAWSTSFNGASSNGRLDLRRPQGGLPMRGITLYGAEAASGAVVIDPTLATYADAEATYYSRMLTIQQTQTHWLPIVAASTNYTLLPGPYGSIILHQTAFNFTWLALEFRSDGKGAYAFENEIGDTGSTEYQRTGTNLFLPVHKWTLNRILSGDSGGTGSPLGGVAWINLPSSWSACTDLFGGSYAFRDDFMGATLDTTTNWNRVQTGGTCEIYTTFQWLQVIGDGTWAHNGCYTKTYSTAHSVQKHFVCDVYFPSGSDGNSANLVVGWFDGAGYSYSNAVHGIDFTFSGSNIIVVFENGTSRGTVGSGYVVGNTYRVRITLQTSTTAKYEIQSSGADYAAPLGSATWTDITPGTTLTATTPVYPGVAKQSAFVAYVGDVRVY